MTVIVDFADALTGVSYVLQHLVKFFYLHLLQTEGFLIFFVTSNTGPGAISYTPQNFVYLLFMELVI